MSLQIAALDRFPEIAWKNGGGTTRLIASLDTPAFPAGFAWRVSVATITGDSTFSRFVATRRLLGLASAGRLTLHVASEPPVTLQQPGDITAFYGGDETRATCTGPLQVLNLMLAPGSLQAGMTAHSTPFTLGAQETCFILPLTGEWRPEVASNGAPDTLEPGRIGFWRGAGEQTGLLPQGAGASCLVARVQTPSQDQSTATADMGEQT